MKKRKVAKNIIQNNIYLSIATSDENACWNAPLFYSIDNELNFYFISDKRSRHAKHISQNPYVACTIFNSQETPEKVNGVQFDGLVKKLEFKEIPKAIQIIYKNKKAALLKKRFIDYKDPASYIKLTNFRIYKIIPLHFYILNPKIIDNDIRVEVKLDQ